MTPSVTTRTKQLVWNDPALKAAELQRRLENDGYRLSTLAIATIRHEFLADLKLLTELDLIKNRQKKFEAPVTRTRWTHHDSERKRRNRFRQQWNG